MTSASSVESFGQWLAGRLLAIRKSQRWLAKEIGVQEPIVSKWKHDKEAPTERWRVPLATALRVTPDTVPIRSDVKTGEVSPGVTGGSVRSGDTPSPQQEDATVDYWGEKARGFVVSLPEALQPKALDVLEEWRKGTAIRHSPQPAARGPLRHDRKK